ncbi:hypothetical protein BLNAU_22262 [Blattamonas nauphoetae]|uniref:Uncharacterized protein n=1 Tax=Blattamonas nauphoetae TaxID=2049346 RepID=A0ABQ9WTI6_9EUKA|nr:hypothetical protein BLNAU_22262 [Blattamonas nauphoetae]
MRQTIVALNTPNDTRVVPSSNSPLTVKPVHEPFLNFSPNSELSFEDKSTIYCSLVALVKDEHPFCNALLDNASLFLESLEPFGKDRGSAAVKLVTDLVPSSTGSAAGFVESILSLFSSPDVNLVSTALQFLSRVLSISTPATRLLLVDSDLFTNLFVIVNPHTLPLSGNGRIADKLIWNIKDLLELSFPSTLRELEITAATDQDNHREMIFRKLVIPSSQFQSFLISNWNAPIPGFFRSTIIMLGTILRIGPFHLPTLEFILASPIVRVLISSLHRQEEWNALTSIESSLKGWKAQDSEVLKSGKRIVQAMFLEGLEDTLEQTRMYGEDRPSHRFIVDMCHSVLMFLGANESEPPYPHPPFWA